MTRSTEEDEWMKKIEELFAAGRLTSHQCTLYSRNFQKDDNDDEICGCQRPIRHHSFDGLSDEQGVKSEDWNFQTHTRKLKQLIYHSTTSRKVGFWYIFSVDPDGTYFQMYHLVSTMCM